MKDAKPYNDTKATGTIHSLGTLKRAVKELGQRAIDGRTALARELSEERRGLIAALGGEGEVSPQELAIIDMIAQKRVRAALPFWRTAGADKTATATVGKDHLAGSDHRPDYSDRVSLE